MPSDERNSKAMLAAQLQHQVDELAQRRYRPPARHDLLRVMRQRRRRPAREQARAARAAGGNRVAQFDYLPAEVGWDTLLAAGELLITRESFAGAEPYLSALGMREEQLGCTHLRGEMLKLTHREGREHLTAPELANIARQLRQQGFYAALTHMTVTGPVGKGHGGPRPVRARKRLGSGGGRPPKVAIIDTGISPQRRASVSAGSQLDELHQFPLGNSREAREEREGYLSFDAGHGTFVTGIVQQLAPDAEITVYRAVDSDGIGSEVDVACAMIQAVTEDGNQIINLSLGGHTHDDIPPIAIHRALEIIRKWERAQPGREVIVVAAAGNYGDTRPCWPAAFPGVVSVAALTPGMMPAPWSSRGFWVTCAAIGQGLVSTFVEGTESPVVAPQRSRFRGNPPWAAWSGTSFAAPQIVGALASGYQSGGEVPLRDLLDTILSGGRPVPGFGQAVKVLPGT